jgi:hypothetical protein
MVLVLEKIFRHLRINYVSRDKFSCGEFVTEAFEQAGVTLFPDREPQDVLPADFARFLPAEAPEVTLDPATGAQVTVES